jgi:hypothetical protein
MQASAQFTTQWKKLRRIELLVIVGVLAFIPAGMSGAILIGRFTKDERVAALAPIAIMVFIVINWLRYMFFPCPQCGKWFHSKFAGGITRGRHCMHCGLARYGA